MKKVLAILLALAMIFTLAACGEEKEEAQTSEETFKVGLICIGDENDQGYTYNFLRGQKAAAEQLKAEGYNVEWIMKYNFIAGAEVEDANRDLVEAGCKLIYNNSYDHAYEIPAVASEYPEVQFVGMTNENLRNDDLDNTSNAFAEIYKGRYLAGVAAGMKLQEMIDQGQITADRAVIGYVGAFAYAEVKSGYTAYFLGARSVCPSVTMKVQFVGSWSDATEEGKAAKALIDQGCVMISQHSDNTTPASEAEKTNGKVFHTGYNNDMTGVAPNASIISTRIDWTKYFVETVKKAYDGGTLDPDYCGTLANGEVVLTDLNEAIAAPGTAEKLKEVEAGLTDGSIKVFDTKTFTVGGAELTSAFANDTDGDWVNDADEAVFDGQFNESVLKSAPYFAIDIDGITLLN